MFVSPSVLKLFQIAMLSFAPDMSREEKRRPIEVKNNKRNKKLE